MQNAIDLTLQLGQFAMLVIVVCVVVMLFISFFERHPRSKQLDDDLSRNNPNDSEELR